MSLSCTRLYRNRAGRVCSRLPAPLYGKRTGQTFKRYGAQISERTVQDVFSSAFSLRMSRTSIACVSILVDGNGIFSGNFSRCMAT